MADQPIRTATGQPYGAAKAQADAQRALPLPQVNPLEAAIVPLSAPTQRPNEHVMTGAPAGPGPGPAELGIPSANPGPTEVLEQLRTIAQMYPTPELLDLLNDMRA